MDQDRKSTPLKSLQGRIWKKGYRSGELLSQVFEDVPPAMERWHRQGKRVCIYSSGSVLAQKLLFGFTVAGDLTPLISAYFDTGVGAKMEAESYRRIASALQIPPEEILFISDVVTELDAAQAAGMQSRLSLRTGNRPQPENLFQAIHSFAELV
jgi:enolase-phosphatase E1